MPTSPDSMAARMSRSDRTLIRWQVTRRRGSLLAAPAVATLVEQRIDFALEVLEILEALINACEPDVGDLVDLAQLGHRQSADSRRGNLALPGRPQLGLDLVGRDVGGVVGHRSPRERLAQSGRELLPIEFLSRAVALEDDESRRLDSLICRE